jgi:hypothetical protein
MKSFVLLILLAGCHGLSTTAPETDVRIATAYGTVGVWSDGATYDVGKIRSALERGQERALAQRSDVSSLEGATVAIWSKGVPVGTGQYDGEVGSYDSMDDSMSGLQGVEEVFEHEVQHRASWKLGERGECFNLQDHSPGFDLNCGSRP